MDVITSTKNKWVKYVQQLSKPRYRKKYKEFVLEGWHLIEEALHAQATLVHVFVDEHVSIPLDLESLNCPKTLVDSHVLKAMATTPTPQGIIAIAKQLELPQASHLKGKLLVLDRVQDPGNVGTMIRTADAAGFDGVILSDDSVDIYNQKVIRSTQGSLYHLPCVYTSLAPWMEQWIAQGGSVYGTELNEDAVDYRTLHPKGNFAVIMGNEGQGVSQELLERTTQNVYLPMKGRAESLNVAVATGILLFRWNE